MKKPEYTTEPRTFTVEGYTATCNIRFRVWDNVGGRRSYHVSQAEVGKAIKALAKAAGFKVLGVSSQSYSGGDSVDIHVETELTPEQIVGNKNTQLQYGSCCHPDYTDEPRGKLLHAIVGHFESGNFNGSEDIYEYRQSGATVLDPAGDAIYFTTKYGFEHFTTKEEWDRWHK